MKLTIVQNFIYFVHIFKYFLIQGLKVDDVGILNTITQGNDRFRLAHSCGLCLHTENKQNRNSYLYSIAFYQRTVQYIYIYIK